MLAAWLLAAAVSQVDTATASVEIEAMVQGAQGLDLLVRGEVSAAIGKLERARVLDPRSSAIARDLALAYAKAGRDHDALQAIEAARALGDHTTEAMHLRAMLWAQAGEPIASAEAAAESEDWEGDLIGIVVGDPSAGQAGARVAGEPTARGALSALVLAARAAEGGAVGSARALAGLAERTALDIASTPLVLAARSLLERLEEDGSAVTAAARLRTLVTHSTNPRYDADGSGDAEPGLRWSVAAEGAVQIPIGIARLDAVLRADQHVYITARDALQDLDVTAFAAALGFEIPLTDRPDAARFGAALRFRDTFGRQFAVHYATTIEGGPTLTLPLAAGLDLQLGVFGVSTDFISLSPPDMFVDSQNRDLIGQRALASLDVRTEWLHGRIEALFIRDDAEGNAFDNRGGAVGARLDADLGDGLLIRTGAGLTVRQFGPVGEEAVIGRASRRTEVRTAIEIGAYVPLVEGLAAVVENTWINNSARTAHGWTTNVVSVGMEAVF